MKIILIYCHRWGGYVLWLIAFALAVYLALVESCTTF